MSNLFQLQADFKPMGPQKATIDQLVQGLSHGLWQQTLQGITGCGKTFIMANVIEATQRPAIILAHNKTLAAQLYHEMSAFFPKNSVELFVSYYDYYQPEAYVVASDTYIAKDASVNEHIEQMRLSATKAILERNDTIIVASVSAIYGLGDPAQYLKMVLHLRTGHTLDQKSLFQQLARMQYTRNDLALKRGTFRVHGDVIDIHPAEQEKEALRIEMFDDEIEALRLFDPLTGQVLKNISRFTVHPKTHYVTPKPVIDAAIIDIEAELRTRLAELNDGGRLVEAQRLAERTRFDCEMMAELGYCTGIENYARYLSGREAGKAPATLMDYLPENAILFVDESHVTMPQVRGMYHGDQSRKENLVHYGFRLPSAKDNRPLTFDEFLAIAPQGILVSATPGAYEKAHSAATVELNIRPTGLLDPHIEVKPATAQVEDALSEIHKAIEQGERVLVTTLTKKMAEYLSDYVADHGIKTRYLHSDIDTVERVEILRDLRKGAFDVLVGINLLREGLDLPEVGLVLILDADKMGFLRSESALIQTMGRAARHVNGRAILYGDRMTEAMASAIDQTRRRRQMQQAYNKTHGITPKAVGRSLEDGLNQSTQVPTENLEEATILALSPEAFAKHLASMEKEMIASAEDLAFEKAARLRDQMESLHQAYWKR